VDRLSLQFVSFDAHVEICHTVSHHVFYKIIFWIIRLVIHFFVVSSCFSYVINHWLVVTLCECYPVNLDSIS